MQRKSKKHIYLPVALVIYSSVMAFIGYPRYKAMDELKEFWIIYGASLVLSVVLHFVLKGREKRRDKFRKGE